MSQVAVMQHGAALTMSSREIADLVEARHNDVVATIERLFNKGLLRSSRKTRREETGGRPIEVYDLIERDTHLVVSGYSDEHRARVIDRWQELESKQQSPRQLSTAEMLLQSAQLMVDMERKIAEQQRAIAAVSNTVETLADTMLMQECPSNAEPITRIRARISKIYGVPAHIVDTVMRQLPYSPKPAGMVKNLHENAAGSSYAVYWVKDVNHVFRRFVSECQSVTPTKATHPDIGIRFSLAIGAEVSAKGGVA